MNILVIFKRLSIELRFSGLTFPDLAPYPPLREEGPGEGVPILSGFLSFLDGKPEFVELLVVDPGGRIA